MKDGGPAFPCLHGQGWEDGMTLRQWYKGKIAAGELASQSPETGERPTKDADKFAARVAALADALLREDEEAGR